MRNVVSPMDKPTVLLFNRTNPSKPNWYSSQLRCVTLLLVSVSERSLSFVDCFLWFRPSHSHLSASSERRRLVPSIEASVSCASSTRSERQWTTSSPTLASTDPTSDPRHRSFRLFTAVDERAAFPNVLHPVQCHETRSLHRLSRSYADQ